MKTAWYLGHSENQISDRAILVGDPDRIDRIAELLAEPKFLPPKRGLRTVVGNYNNTEVTVVAFGMGSPIATIVLHELADLGTKIFLRIGTAMHFPPAVPGNYLISENAVSFEGTSSSYYDGKIPVDADKNFVKKLMKTADKLNQKALTGTFATFDAFYRDMFGMDEDGKTRVSKIRKKLINDAVLATDMETSALLAAAKALKVDAASLCLGTVCGISQKKLDAISLKNLEKVMFEIALKAITSD
jgi:uridine phosphorylase